MFGVMALATTAFTGCSDDDDPNYGKAAAGQYSGDLTVSGIDEPFEDVAITVTRKSDNTVDITAKVSFQGEEATPVELPVKLEGVALSGSLDNIALTYKGKVDLSALGNQENKSLDAELSAATIKGENKLSFKLTVKGFKTEGAEEGADLTVTVTDALKKEAK